MPKKSEEPSASVRKLAKWPNKGDFLTDSVHLQAVYQKAPHLFLAVAKLAGIGTRKAYALVEIADAFIDLQLDIDRLRRIGWTKAHIIRQQVNQANLEELLTLAETYNVPDLQAVMKGDLPPPKMHAVSLYLSPRQHKLFEAVLLAHGAVKTGKGLSQKEQALTLALSKVK